MRHGRDPSLRELKNFFKIFCQPFPIFRKFVNGYDRTHLLRLRFASSIIMVLLLSTTVASNSN